MTNALEKGIQKANFTLIDSVGPLDTEVWLPNGKETWRLGTTSQIRWNKDNGKGTVKIELLKAGKASLTIHNNTKNDGSYLWKIPSLVVIGSAYKIKITSTTNSSVTDTSNRNFTIAKAEEDNIKVLSPQSGARYFSRNTILIRWSSKGAGSTVEIFVQTLGPDAGSHSSIIKERTFNDGIYRWSVPIQCRNCGPWTNSRHYRIWVRSVETSTLYGWSNKFTLCFNGKVDFCLN